LYATHDGGTTWNDASDITPLAQSAGPRAFGLPMAVDGRSRLLLPVTMTIPDSPSLFMLYSSTDGGQSWITVALTPIGDNVNAGYVVPSYIFDGGYAVVFAPDGTAYQSGTGFPGFESFTPTQTGAVRNVFSQTGFFTLHSLDFLDPQNGWGLVTDAGCERFKTKCWDATFIEQTYDGGQSWSPLIMPGGTPTPFP
jgi:hypothetical protein